MASNSRVTGLPGRTELTADTVENTVEETDDCSDEANRVRCSISRPELARPCRGHFHETRPSSKVEYVDVRTMMMSTAGR